MKTFPRRRRRLLRLAAICGCLWPALPVVAGAQESSRFRPAVSSEAGVYAEGYSIDGRAPRRPSGTVRLYASPTVEWMGIQIGANLLWSTEQRFVAQPMNRFYVNPRWSWGQLHAGDYVPEIGRYGVTGVRVRGGGAEVSAKRLRVSVAGGRSQESTDLSTFDAAPARTLVAGLVGVGERGRSFIEITGLRAADERRGTDSLSAPPQENVVGGLSGGLALFGGRWTLKGDAAGSLFSRDTRAGELEGLDQPAWTRSVFTPRLSSRADYAWNVETRLNARRGSLGAQMEYVGPGFTSLGNPYFQNDRREARLLGSLRLMGGRVSASGSVGGRWDNLAGDKLATTRRTVGSLAFTAITRNALISTASVLVNGMVREPDLARSPLEPTPGFSDSLRLANVTVAATLTEQLRFEQWGMAQHVALSVTEQRVDDTSPRYGSLLDATSRSLAVEYGVTVAELYAITLRPSYQRFASSGEDRALSSFSAGISRRAPRSPVSASVSSTYTPVGAGGQLRHDALGSYRLNARSSVSAQLRHSTLSGTAGAFTERTASLRLTHRW